MPAPTVQSVSPSQYDLGSTGVSVTISGQNFTSDAQVSFSSGVTVRSTTFVDAGTLNAVIDVTGTIPVSGDVGVSNGSGSGTLVNAYSTVDPNTWGP
jgi:hypothetical protein